MQREKLKIEEKELDFGFVVLNVQFNETGRYALRLTLENPLLEGSGSGVQLRVNDGDVLYTNTDVTDIIAQTNLNEVYTFTQQKFVFTLPRGFCKNDKNHDVRLRIEALQTKGSSLNKVKKAGEAFFAIYPRTNQPRINLYASKNEDLYHYSSIMTLLRVKNDALAMHCGRLAYTVFFRESRPPVKEAAVTKFPPLSIQNKQEDGPLIIQTPRTPSPLPPEETAMTQHVLSGDINQPDREDLYERNQTPYPTAKEHSPELLDHQPAYYEQQSEYADDTPPDSPVQEQNVPSRLPSTSSLHFPSPAYTPISSPEHRKVTADPLGILDYSKFNVSHDAVVSPPGTEVISIILHGATNLPSTTDGAVPQPFVIVRRGASNKQQLQLNQRVTHATLHPTHSPSWEEKVTLEMDKDDADNEDVVLDIADSITKELLAEFSIPVKYLQPFHHYHLELQKLHKNAPSMVRLFITIIRRGSFIPRQAGFSFTGFEVLLQAVEKPLRNPVGPLLVVARIVSHYKAYKEAVLLQRPKAAGITMSTIMFPNPRLSSFEVHHGSSNGHPQVTGAGNPPEQPRWNHLFLFQGRDCATIFTDGSALILEYYSVTTVMNVVSWNVCNPLGFSSLPLNQEVYEHLVSDSGRCGIRLENLPIQGTILKTTSNTSPTVGLLLHLVVSERPDSFLPGTNPDGLSLLQLKPFSFLQHKTRGVTRVPSDYPVISIKEDRSLYPDVHRDTSSSTELQKDGAALPSHDALAKLLPEYEHIFRAQGPSQWKQRDQNEEPRPHQTAELRNVQNGGETTSYIGEEHERRDVTSHEVKELENYQAAMQKMAEDIIALRQHLSSLESENSKLRSELSLHEDVGRTLLEDTDIDVMTKAEIADRIASLRHKLASETAEIRQYKDKIQQLHNELIRKNDSEKELLLLQRAHQQQQAVLEKYQEKLHRAKLLEDTIRQQEKVIEKMEKVLDSKLKQKTQEKPRGTKQNQVSTDVEHKWNEINSALTAENSRLRYEMEKLRLQPPVPLILQQEPQQVQDLFSDSEKLGLLTKLERAQGRIQLLEAQLEENARKWGREKQELLTRLMEQDHGFARTSTMVLHDFPLKNASDSLLTHNRYRKLDPLV